MSRPPSRPLLADALGFADHVVIAFTGAGGKTTALFRCARELHAARASVVVTTTTRIFVPPAAPDLALVVEADHDAALRGAAAALELGLIAVVGTAKTLDGKLTGIPQPWVADLAALHGVAHVLVEADGSARLPITAPREGEPVIPASTTLVVAVVGIDALGATIETAAHRPERVAALTGLARDARLDARAIARVLLDPAGNTKGAPSGVRVVALVNKADDDEALAAARAVSRELRSLRDVRVVITSLEAPDPVREVVGG